MKTLINKIARKLSVNTCKHDFQDGHFTNKRQTSSQSTCSKCGIKRFGAWGRCTGWTYWEEKV